MPILILIVAALLLSLGAVMVQRRQREKRRLRREDRMHRMYLRSKRDSSVKAAGPAERTKRPIVRRETSD